MVLWMLLVKYCEIDAFASINTHTHTCSNSERGRESKSRVIWFDHSPKQEDKQLKWMEFHLNRRIYCVYVFVASHSTSRIQFERSWFKMNRTKKNSQISTTKWQIVVEFKETYRMKFFAMLQNDCVCWFRGLCNALYTHCIWIICMRHVSMDGKAL